MIRRDATLSTQYSITHPDACWAHVTCSQEQYRSEVEGGRYRCESLPCQAWRISGKKCYRCDQSCQQFGDLRSPAVSDLLGSLHCDRGCQHLVVTSEAGAAIWQNKRTGLFTFIGEHNGRPLYQKNSTKEYLYYVNGSEWMIGPDFRRVHAGQWRN